MRLHRFYAVQPLGEEVVIENVSILKQWNNVFRYKKGSLVILFNGEGDDVTYSIESISTKEAVLSRQKLEPSYVPMRHVTLYLSLIKKDNFELAVQKATELGVSAVVPILSARSEKKNLNGERLLRIAAEASEQCGRGDVPTILEPMTLAQVFGVPLIHDATYVLQMGGADIKGARIQKELSGSKHVGLFVGPEGGWADEEETLFKENNIIGVSLGNTVLRAETAAIVSCAFVCE